MISPYPFTVENLKTGFKINLDSHNVNDATSILSIMPIYPDLGIKARHINKNLKEMAGINARLINQYKFNYPLLFSASFYKINEEDQRNDEIELFINLNFFENLTESDFNNIDAKSQLEHQIQGTKDSGWIFDKIISMQIR